MTIIPWHNIQLPSMQLRDEIRLLLILHNLLELE